MSIDRLIDLQVRYGHMSVLPDMSNLTEEKVGELVKTIQAAKDADTGKSADGEPVNVLHVALMKVGRGWGGVGFGMGWERRGGDGCLLCLGCVWLLWRSCCCC